ncbi:endomucin isoform X2 [Peromyscus leucopus]|uniref:endomucin isoform X2 n=1 Tax=Peromyscus leucopus TaxID=10041 RepID=UPI0018856701|nr:endomucin isoform X2 [Peromyscus leucopus]
MRLLQVTALFFLVSSCICQSEDSGDVQNISTPSLPENSTTKSSVTTTSTVAIKNLSNPTVGTPAKEPTTPSLIKNEVPTTNTTVPNPLVSNAVSTLPSSQHKTENQSSIKTPEVPVDTQLPDASPKTIVPPSASLTTAKTIPQLQDTEDGKITATPSTTPSYSSTPENGNDQPQSDKESVKLLTVKTISHESGEHSAQGKTKN